MEHAAKRVAMLLKALANENRLLILCALIKGPKAVGALGDMIPGITQPALSQHLALLKAHGILDCDKVGQHVVYRIADDRVEGIMAVLKAEYCD